jgi:uncharacterized membrane protein
MDTTILFNIMLVGHVIGSMISLLLGLYILIRPKGTPTHRTIGNIYFYAMLIGAVLAIPMSIIHPNIFLLIIGVWTTYMLVTGKRYLQIKTTSDFRTSDMVISIGMTIFGLGMPSLGIYLWMHGNGIGIVAGVFGVIILGMVWQDFSNYRGRSRFTNFGLLTHIQRMVGSYIGSVTAFMVVNNSEVLPDVVAWLLPTLVLTPLLVIWSRKWRRI